MRLASEQKSRHSLWSENFLDTLWGPKVCLLCPSCGNLPILPLSPASSLEGQQEPLKGPHRQGKNSQLCSGLGPCSVHDISDTKCRMGE